MKESKEKPRVYEPLLEAGTGDRLAKEETVPKEEMVSEESVSEESGEANAQGSNAKEKSGWEPWTLPIGTHMAEDAEDGDLFPEDSPLFDLEGEDFSLGRLIVKIRVEGAIRSTLRRIKSAVDVLNVNVVERAHQGVRELLFVDNSVTEDSLIKWKAGVLAAERCYKALVTQIVFESGPNGLFFKDLASVGQSEIYLQLLVKLYKAGIRNPKLLSKNLGISKSDAISAMKLLRDIEKSIKLSDGDLFVFLEEAYKRSGVYDAYRVIFERLHHVSPSLAAIKEVLPQEYENVTRNIKNAFESVGFKVDLDMLAQSVPKEIVEKEIERLLKKASEEIKGVTENRDRGRKNALSRIITVVDPVPASKEIDEMVRKVSKQQKAKEKEKKTRRIPLW